MTTRTSRYYPLNWIVEHRDDVQPWWEPIAAFNHPDVATDYAKMRVNRSLTKKFDYRYRVVARSGRAKFTTIWEQPE